MSKLAGRSAVVTGAAQGIGAAYARALAAEGVKVAVTDIVDPRGVVEAIRTAGGEAIGLISDVCDLAACETMLEAAAKAFGGVDILVNNAAIFAAIERKPFDQVSTAEWDQVMAVNVRGPFNAAKAALPGMKERGYGKIINISSATV